MDVIPEARLNLVIYYLKQDDVNEAFQLIKVYFKHYFIIAATPPRCLSGHLRGRGRLNSTAKVFIIDLRGKSKKK